MFVIIKMNKEIFMLTSMNDKVDFRQTEFEERK